MSQLTHDQSEFNVIFIHSALDEYPLTPEEFRVYAHYARRAGVDGAYPAIASVAKRCRMHEDTARQCLHNLLSYKMLAAQERPGRSTLYRLTRASEWVATDVVLAVQQQQTAVGKAKRASRKAARAASVSGRVAETKGEATRNEGGNIGQDDVRPDPSETKGGVSGGADSTTPPKRREGYPSETKGGHPSETKGAEGTPCQGDPLEVDPSGGVIELDGDARVQGEPLSGSEGDGALRRTTTGEDQEEELTDEDLLVAGELEAARAFGALAPDGAGADAPGGDLAALDQDDESGGGGDEPANDLEKVPRRGARRAQPGEAVYERLEALCGGKRALPERLVEPTPSGGLDRGAWLALTLDQVEAAHQAARRSGKHYRTALFEELDRRIGAPIGASAAAVPAPTSHALASEPVDAPDIAEGSVWVSAKGTRLTVERFDPPTPSFGGSVALANGTDYPLKMFLKLFSRDEAQGQAS